MNFYSYINGPVWSLEYMPELLSYKITLVMPQNMRFGLIFNKPDNLFTIFHHFRPDSDYLIFDSAKRKVEDWYIDVDGNKTKDLVENVYDPAP